jgi:hypothetical protein
MDRTELMAALGMPRSARPACARARQCERDSIDEPMTEGTRVVAAEHAQPVAAGRTPALTPMGTALAIAVIGILVLAAGQASASLLHPVGAGSGFAVLGDAGPCNDDAADPTLCYRAPFAEGREVGIGFTVRNDAPIGMTILGAQIIRDGVLSPAALEPQLLRSEDLMFGLSEGVPFEPVDVPAGEELAIQFVGPFGDCETVARDWSPGSGLVLEEAFMTVRWGVFTTQVQVPSPMSVALEAPTSCP